MYAGPKPSVVSQNADSSRFFDFVNLLIGEKMKMRVLVTYATKYGATAEIAEKIGEVLRQEGLDTDVIPVKQVQDLASYTAVANTLKEPVS